MEDQTDRESISSQASREQSGILNFFWGICTIILTCFSLMVLLFDSPLTGATLGATSIPAIVLFFLSATLALFAIRYANRSVETHTLIISIKYIYLVCGCFAPLGLIVEALILPTTVLLGIGFASATFFLCLYLCDYGYSMLTIMLPVGTLIGGGFGALIYASSFNRTAIVIIAAVALLGSWLILHFKQHTRRYDLLRISNKDSRVRMTMLVDARWTYASMGLGAGFATGIASNNAVFKGLNEAMSSIGLGGWCFLLFIGAVIIGVFLLVIHARLDYLIERYSKEFFSFSIALCVLPLCFGNEVVQSIFLTLLFAVTFLQMVFIINAGVEHMRFDLLSPLWYMAENSFVLIGAMIGIILGFAVDAPSFPSLSLLVASTIVILLTAFAQPFINKSSYPIDSDAESVASAEVVEEAPEHAQAEAARADRRVSEEFFAAALSDDAPDLQGEVVEDDTRNADAQDADEASPAPSHKGLWRLKVEAIVKQYDLSPRQAEVFELLAKGRDAKFIEDTFMISYATAKTHIHNIYKKVDAHSRQDVIDMVEKVDLDQ